MEIEMSSSSICGSYIHTIEDLDLTNFGLPGMTFNGDLHIEADTAMHCEDWYLDRAIGFNLDDKTIGSYSDTLNPVIFAAISKAVYKDDKLCDIIWETSREHA
jgi:hypothetical protein